MGSFCARTVRERRSGSVIEGVEMLGRHAERNLCSFIARLYAVAA